MVLNETVFQYQPNSFFVLYVGTFKRSYGRSPFSFFCIPFSDQSRRILSPWSAISTSCQQKCVFLNPPAFFCQDKWSLFGRNGLCWSKNALMNHYHLFSDSKMISNLKRTRCLFRFWAKNHFQWSLTETVKNQITPSWKWGKRQSAHVAF